MKTSSIYFEHSERHAAPHQSTEKCAHHKVIPTPENNLAQDRDRAFFVAISFVLHYPLFVSAG
jgi:hypothetical protein